MCSFASGNQSGVVCSGPETDRRLSASDHLLRVFLALLVLPGLLTFFSACGPSSGTQDNGKVYVVATTGMIADAARNIGGTHVRVDGLMGPGVDPHSYKVTSSDAKKLSKADVILYNGLNLEGEMGDILKKMNQRKPTYAVTEGIPKEDIIKPRSDLYVHDPHLWFDVRLWARALSTVKTALASYDETHKEAYEANYEAYKNELVALDGWAERQIKRIPEESRILVTAHDAFAYFGRAYDIRVKALQGVSTQSGIGLKDRERLAELIIDNNIRAIFLETSVAGKSIQAVIETCASRGHEVRIGGELFSDAMGPRGTPEGTYVGMVRHNIRTIVKSLTDEGETSHEKE